ncbi:MAG TPA: ABC transporter substrate-binding protein [Burkholderiales bacterium]|nr:ABC transporter substrate-binding protein [Burkholderiales bacterium]
MSDDVIRIIKQDKDIKAGDRAKINALVDAKVLPHFDFDRMTALAMGRNWRKADAEQKKVLIDEFRTLLVRTYSGALASYRNEVIEFMPLHAGAGDTDVTVRTRVERPGSEPIGIDYSMEKMPDGWKVYDVAVAGASLVISYRDSFDTEIKQNGVDGLIKALASKNRSQES